MLPCINIYAMQYLTWRLFAWHQITSFKADKKIAVGFYNKSSVKVAYARTPDLVKSPKKLASSVGTIYIYEKVSQSISLKYIP
jgi:hypothetical protein